MPRVVLRRDELPPVGSDGAYVLRARIVSDDKNAASYYTPIYHLYVPVEGSKYVKDATQANVYHEPIGQGTPQNYNIYVSWHDPNYLGEYDVYTQWHSANGWTPWTLLSTQTSRNFSFNPPLYLVNPADPNTTFDKYNVAVTRTTYDHIYNDALALFSTATMPGGGLSLL